MNENKMVVLVIGVGGNVSQGILKALELSKVNCKVIGACVSPLSLGLYTTDESYICPPANDPLFYQWLIDLCIDKKINAIFSGVEEVLSALSKYSNEILIKSGAVCVVNEVSKLVIGEDKFLTCEWLKGNGFNYPRYALLENKKLLLELVDECGYPLIAKPRKGKGSKGIFIINNAKDLEHIMSFKDYIVQEYLGDSNSEYTAGCFCDKCGIVRGTIVMRRDLLEGTTYRAELGDFPLVREEVIRIAEKFKPMGSCNMQLRISNGKAVCFEINTRLSGTTPIRARLGFNEVEAILRQYVLGEPAYDLPNVIKGTVLRYWNEMYVNEEAVDILKNSGILKNPKDYDLFVEDYSIRRIE